MNHRIILRILSRVAFAQAGLLLLSALVALMYGEAVILPYLMPIGICLAYGAVLGRFHPHRVDFFAREGYVAVGLAWLQLSFFGALPFYLSGQVPSFIDCLFESVSGFTTTGATILNNVEALPRGLLFWRSFTHWIGGMGVLVFLMAVVPLAGGRSIHLMRAESTGPAVGKLVPRLRSTALLLYGLYLSMTLLQTVLLVIGGMPLLDSITTAFSTAGTGGFSIKNTSILAYGNSYYEIVITVFMILFGINFNLFYLLLIRRDRNAFKSEELRWFLGIFAAAAVIITITILPRCQSVAEALRLAAFQSASIMSTTGFASTDYNNWPGLSCAILLLLMFIGSCAGSTAGGFKISRVVILFKSIRNQISRMLHPRQVGAVKFEGKTLEAEVSGGVLNYLAIYVLLMIGGILLLSINGFDFSTTFSSMLTMISNAGPSFGFIGPLGSYSVFSVFSKLVCCLLMLIGRLEIFPILLLFAPSVWRRK